MERHDTSAQAIVSVFAQVMMRTMAVGSMVFIGIILSGAIAHAEESALEQARAAIRIKDYHKAVSVLQPSATGGDAQAQYLLAGIYRNGLAGEVDTDAARRLYEAAAKQNDAAAAFSLATTLASEEPRDPVKAGEWLRRAAAAGYAPAQEALKHGRLPMQFDPRQDLVDATARRGALSDAIRLDDVVSVATLIEDVAHTPSDDFGRSALAQAAAAGAVQSIAWLIGKGSPVGQPDHFGATPLMLAAASGKLQSVQLLLQASADVNARDSVGNNALMYAAREGSTSAITRLIEAGADVRAENAAGLDALDLALRTSHSDAASELGQHGAAHSHHAIASSAPAVPLQHPPARTEDLYRGWSDVLIASSHRSVILLNAVLGSAGRDDLHAANQGGLLSMAVATGSAESLGKLMDAGFAGRSPEAEAGDLAFAVRRGDLPTMQLLISHRKPVGDSSRVDMESIAGAIREHQIRALNLLLLPEPDLEGLDETGKTPLMLAASTAQPDAIKLLLSHGARHATPDKGGVTALGYAARAECADCVSLLLAAGARADSPGADGQTPLAIAAERGAVRCVELLLNGGANPALASKNGSTALMLAAAGGHSAIVQRLLGTGSDLNVQNRFGDTALIVATRASQSQIVRALLHAGADRSLRNRDRAAAEDIAKALGFEDLKTLLHG